MTGAVITVMLQATDRVRGSPNSHPPCAAREALSQAIDGVVVGTQFGNTGNPLGRSPTCLMPAGCLP
ncbi:MAG: hypothetical protein Q6K99_11405 [Thermostichales cyanobacterium BF4_bins_65]